MAGRKIKNEPDTDYLLIGIATTLKEYKLCYHLNQILQVEFQKQKDLIFDFSERTRSVTFSVFTAGSEEDKNQFVVFANKNINDVLLPEVVNFDYILQIRGKCEYETIENLIREIKQLNGIIHTSELPLEKIKSRERLVYEEERPSHRLFNAKRHL